MHPDFLHLALRRHDRAVHMQGGVRWHGDLCQHDWSHWRLLCLCIERMVGGWQWSCVFSGALFDGWVRWRCWQVHMRLGILWERVIFQWPTDWLRCCLLSRSELCAQLRRGLRLRCWIFWGRVYCQPSGHWVYGLSLWPVRASGQRLELLCDPLSCSDRLPTHLEWRWQL